MPLCEYGSAGNYDLLLEPLISALRWAQHFDRHPVLIVPKQLSAKLLDTIERKCNRFPFLVHNNYFSPLYQYIKKQFSSLDEKYLDDKVLFDIQNAIGEQIDLDNVEILPSAFSSLLVAGVSSLEGQNVIVKIADNAEWEYELYKQLNDSILAPFVPRIFGEYKKITEDIGLFVMEDVRGKPNKTDCTDPVEFAVRFGAALDVYNGKVFPESWRMKMKAEGLLKKWSPEDSSLETSALANIVDHIEKLGIAVGQKGGLDAGTVELIRKRGKKLVERYGLYSQEILNLCQSDPLNLIHRDLLVGLNVLGNYAFDWGRACNYYSVSDTVRPVLWSLAKGELQNPIDHYIEASMIEKGIPFTNKPIFSEYFVKHRKKFYAQLYIDAVRQANAALELGYHDESRLRMVSRFINIAAMADRIYCSGALDSYKMPFIHIIEDGINLDNGINLNFEGKSVFDYIYHPTPVKYFVKE
ncbi:MAG: hypothetical protein KKF44_11480 [Nanoarchaeota archaeon]|nr:hypothetical protein [Nanoarchaeota archaeon]